MFGESLMSLFDSDPEVIRLGMIRIFYVVCFESLNSVMDILSGALRGYGYSLPPALLALIGICGVRLAWVWLVFPFRRAFDTLMMCYPISWAVACVLIAIAYVHYTNKAYACAQLEKRSDSSLVLTDFSRLVSSMLISEASLRFFISY